MLKNKLPLALIPLSLFCLTLTSHARLNTLTGGISTGYDYDQTKYDSDNGVLVNNQYFKQMNITPLLILESTSSIDGLTLTVNPSIVYNLDTYDTNFNSNFSLTAFREFTRKLRIELSEGYIYSDDPELIQATNISDYNVNRRRYWTNDFNINSLYEYASESTFGLGYTYRILRNDDTGIGGYEDYDRHIGDITLQHHINAAWNFGLTASYTEGLFDPPEIELGVLQDPSNDLSEYRAGVSLNWILSSRTTAFTTYDYIDTDYDALLRNDNNIHNLTIGSTFQYSPRLTLEAGGGPSYEKTDTFDSNLDYNAHASFDYALAEHTTFSFIGEKGYDQQNFSAGNTRLGSNQGLTEFWDWRMDLTHALTADIALTAFASYRDERQRNITYLLAANEALDGALEDADRETLREESIFNRDIYIAGGSAHYTFMQWYTAALNYTYRNQDSELLNDSYDEHRVVLTLSFQKELLRW